MAVWSQSYLKREKTDMESGELASGCSKWGTKFLNNSTGPAAKEGSGVPLLLARASGEGRDGLGREPHQWKTSHLPQEEPTPFSSDGCQEG